MIGGAPGDSWIKPTESRFAKVQFINKTINGAYWIIFANVVLQSRRVQCRLIPRLTRKTGSYSAPVHRAYGIIYCDTNTFSHIDGRPQFAKHSLSRNRQSWRRARVAR
jgi:hypothetical protein